MSSHFNLLFTLNNGTPANLIAENKGNDIVALTFLILPLKRKADSIENESWENVNAAGLPYSVMFKAEAITLEAFADIVAIPSPGKNCDIYPIPFRPTLLLLCNSPHWK